MSGGRNGGPTPVSVTGAALPLLALREPDDDAAPLQLEWRCCRCRTVVASLDVDRTVLETGLIEIGDGAPFVIAWLAHVERGCEPAT